MSTRTRTETDIQILLVEDNPADARLVDEAFDALDREVELSVVEDGYAAIQRLKRHGTADPPTRPDIVLLDLNIPGKDGCDVLETIRDDPQLRSLPVLVLTSSARSADVSRCYESFANAFVTKPAELDGFLSLVESIDWFWFENAQFPPLPR